MIPVWELDHKGGWALKNRCFQIVVLEKTLESPLDSKEIKPVSPNWNQLCIFMGKTEAEAPILWLPDVKSQVYGRDDVGKDWRQEDKVGTENDMVGWHHRFYGHEFDLTQGDGEGQGSLTCCSPQGCKELDVTQRVNKDKTMQMFQMWNKTETSHYRTVHRFT